MTVCARSKNCTMLAVSEAGLDWSANVWCVRPRRRRRRGSTWTDTRAHLSDVCLHNCAPTIVGRDKLPPFILGFTSTQIDSLPHWMSYRRRKALAHHIIFYTASPYHLLYSHVLCFFTIYIFKSHIGKDKDKHSVVFLTQFKNVG